MGIIAVSDVHLGYLKEDDSKQSLSNKSGFCDLLRDIEARDDIDRLVICGDMLDMWRRDMVGVTIENLDVLNMLQSLSDKKKIKVYYLAGNHDTPLLKPLQTCPSRISCWPVSYVLI